jgi:hypothetical protein
MALPCHALSLISTNFKYPTRTRRHFHRNFTPQDIYHGAVKKECVVVGAALLIGLFPPTSASADPTPSPTPSIDTYKMQMEKFKKDRETFMQAMQERSLKLRVINSEFKSAVDKAVADSKVALVSATTPAQKSAIAATRQSAISSAIAARDSAIAALGAMPTPPVAPIKSERSAGDQRGKQKR